MTIKVKIFLFNVLIVFYFHNLQKNLEKIKKGTNLQQSLEEGRREIIKKQLLIENNYYSEKAK